MGYRQCDYERIDYSNLKSKKLAICSLIDERVKSKGKRGSHYKKISKKNGNYYTDFGEIYELKCAYCGINTAINPTNMFEIDHFINGKQIKTPDGKTVNHIGNLVFSCRKCNQAKGDFHVNGAYSILHPDNGILPSIFERDDHYAIKINSKYADNKTVRGFYEKLGFPDRFRKLDYLLLNLYYLKDNKYDEKIQNVILKVYTHLLELRNKQV
ncbi:HNH endonuclease [Enterococcus durans]|uniref:HNH endonuclease n=1 Tax=Enterococcus durans TaxID=53345 RepID=UPI001431C02E|nr:HNH endonuclease [Enterococcus durans]NJE63043.1 HNH endonuclease [Enterococcus durans]